MPIRGRLTRNFNDDTFDSYVGHAARFEQTLAADGALVLKFWLHLPRKELKRRLAGERPNGDEPWQIQESDEAVLDSWHRWYALANRLLEVTDSPAAQTTWQPPTRWWLAPVPKRRPPEGSVGSA